MIKIAVMSTDDNIKHEFCAQLEAEFKEKGKKALVIANKLNPYQFNNHGNEIPFILWSFAGQMLSEIQHAHYDDFDVLICQSTIIDPFLYAQVIGRHDPELGSFANGAFGWMEQYDTIVYIKNSKLVTEVLFEETEIGMLELAYERWVERNKDRYPISVLHSDSITKNKNKWLKE